ncbi:MAG TPA: hypothetical protein VM328_07570 [Fimbriimonadaceae bacterium]|jgi:hypothetical protein|nr:hypothetical protein [Fimbriimonadaceae bacterium]
MSEPEATEVQGNQNLLRIILVICWSLVLAKAGFIVLSTKTPIYIEIAYIVALPTVLWNLKRGRELLGSYFYVGLLAVVGIAAAGWVAKEWFFYIESGSESLRALGRPIGTTVLALNFIILLYFIGKELVLSAPERRVVAFPEPPTHPAPSEEPVPRV